ncbi:MAG: PadR family transcriptional regulator [bacterium]|nr:PadR family transcriptional regulator [bacterium]
MKGSYLGEFEELLLLTVGSLANEAYGVAIMDEINKETSRNVNISAVHAVLRRLEEKNYLESEMRGATSERGGRRKRYFKLTMIGKKAVVESMEVRSKLYNRIPDLAFKFSI